MVLGFGSGPRFQDVKEATPGPGEYDVTKDPRVVTKEIRSSFLGNERFREDERDVAPTMLSRDSSPTRERRIRAHNPDTGRKFSWATQRIHDLTQELDHVKQHLQSMEDIRREEREELLSLSEQYQKDIDEIKNALCSAEADKQAIAAKARALEAHVQQLQLQLQEVAAQHSATMKCKQEELEAAQLKNNQLSHDNDMLLKAAEETGELLRVTEESKGIITEQLEATLQKLSQLEQQLQQSTSVANNLQQQLQAMEKEAEQHKIVMNEQVAALNASNVRETELAEKCQDRDAALAELNRKNQSLSAELQAAMHHAADVEAAVEKHQVTIADMQRSLAERDSSLQAQAERLQQHQAEAKVLQQEMATAQKQQMDTVAELQRRSQELEAAQTALASKDEQANAMQQKLVDATQQLSEQKQLLEQQLERAEEHAQEVLGLQAALEQHQGQVRELQLLVNEQSAENMRQQAVIQEDREKLEDAMSGLQRVKDALQLEMDSKQQALQEAADNLATVKEQLLAATQELQSVKEAHEAERSTLLCRQTELEAALATSAADVSNLQKSVTVLQEQVEQLTHNNTTLMADLESAVCKTAELTDEWNSTQQALSLAESQLVKAAEELEVSKTECFQLKVEVSNARAAVGDEQKKHEESKVFLQSVIASKDSAIEALQTREDALVLDVRTQLDSLLGTQQARSMDNCSSREVLRAYAAENSKKFSKLEADLSLAQTNINELQAQLADRQDEVQSLAKEKIAVEQAMAVQADKLEALQQQLIANQAALSEKMAALQHAVDYTTHLEAELEAAQAHTDNVTTQLQDAAQELSTSREQLEKQLDTTTRDVESLAQQVLQRDATLEEVRAEMAAMATELQEELARTVQQLQDLQAQAASAAHTAALQIEELKRANAERELTLKEQLAAETNQHGASKLELDRVKQELQQLQQQVSSTAEQYQDMTQQLSALTIRCTTAEHELGVTQQKLEQAEGEVHSARAGAADDRIAAAKHVEALEAALTAAEANKAELVHQLQDKLAEYDKEVQRSCAVEQELQQQLNDCRAELVSKEELLIAERASAAELQEQCACGAEALRQATAAIADKQLQLDEVSRQHAEARATLNRMSEERSALAAAIANAEGQLQQQDAIVAGMRQQLTNAQEQAQLYKAQADELKLSCDYKDAALAQQQSSKADSQQQLEAAMADLSVMEVKLREADTQQKVLQDALERSNELAADAQLREEQMGHLQRELAAAYTELQVAKREAAYSRRMVEKTEDALLESRRLADENAALEHRMSQMEIDLQQLSNTTGLGHNNPKQKIQYHLRLKQELEELRRECTALLRERFQLEQCVRYLAARSDLAMQPRKAVEEDQLRQRIPASSLTRHEIFATPIGRKQMQLAGRGRVAAQEQQGTTYKPKEALELDIQDVVAGTETEMRKLATEVLHGVAQDASAHPEPCSPPRAACSPRSNVSPRAGAADCMSPGARGGRQLSRQMSEVEGGIVQRILDICAPVDKQTRVRASQVAAARVLSRTNSLASSPTSGKANMAMPRLAMPVSLRRSCSDLPC